MIKKWIRARCPDCGWHGSKYKILFHTSLPLGLYECPNCDSDNIELYSTKKN